MTRPSQPSQHSQHSQPAEPAQFQRPTLRYHIRLADPAVYLPDTETLVYVPGSFDWQDRGHLMAESPASCNHVESMCRECESDWMRMFHIRITSEDGWVLFDNSPRSPLDT